MGRVLRTIMTAPKRIRIAKKKILITQTNVHLSIHPRVCSLKISTTCPACVPKCPRSSMTLQAQRFTRHVQEQAKRRRAMKFVPTKKNHRSSCLNCSPNWFFHEILKNLWFVKKTLGAPQFVIEQCICYTWICSARADHGVRSSLPCDKDPQKN